MSIDLLTRREAAERLGISVRQLERRIAAGTLRTVRQERAGSRGNEVLVVLETATCATR